MFVNFTYKVVCFVVAYAVLDSLYQLFQHSQLEPGALGRRCAACKDTIEYFILGFWSLQYLPVRIVKMRL